MAFHTTQRGDVFEQSFLAKSRWQLLLFSTSLRKLVVVDGVRNRQTLTLGRAVSPRLTFKSVRKQTVFVLKTLLYTAIRSPNHYTVAFKILIYRIISWLVYVLSYKPSDRQT